MIRRRTHVSGLLVCVECVRVSDERAQGWQALHGREDDDTVTVIAFCPACVREEFRPQDARPNVNVGALGDCVGAA